MHELLASDEIITECIALRSLGNNLIRRKQLMHSLQRGYSSEANSRRSREKQETRKGTTSNTETPEELLSDNPRQSKKGTHISEGNNFGSSSAEQRNRTSERSEQERRHQKVPTGGQHQSHSSCCESRTE